MIKNYSHVFSILMTVLLQVSSHPTAAQQNKQMFMFQVDGNNYTKRSYDKTGKLKSSQIFKVGDIKKEKDKQTMPLKVYSYDKNSKLQDSSETNYSCKPSTGEIFMNIFPFAEFSVKKTVKINLSSGGTFYPATWVMDKEMPDISFSLSLEGGVLGAFGSSSKINIYNRKVTAHDTLKNTYTITATMKVKAYALGFLMDTIVFTMVETIDPKKGIIRQYFKESNGEYFIIYLNN